MQIEHQPETTVGAIVEANKAPVKGAKADAVVLTNENKAEYDDKILGGGKEGAEADTPEAKAAAEHAKIEADKVAKKAKDAVENEEIDHPDKTKKERLNGRFSELTKARKEAEAKAEAAAKTAAEERTARETAEMERNALKAKYEPPKSDELGPEPLPDQFTDVGEYAKAIKDYTAEKTRKEVAAKAESERQTKERESIGKAFKERQDAAKARIPDFDEKVGASNVQISDQARDAIARSEVGPEIQYHLATHPEEAVALGKLTVGEMYYAIGKLAATLGGSAKAAPKGNGAAPAAEAQISKAPAPITPLGNGGAPVVRLNGGQEVPKNWTYEDYKKARKSGQIQ